MATHAHPTGFALRPAHDKHFPDGAWWPQTRSLTDQLHQLIERWPADRGRVARVLYSPPDWDDHPHTVAVAGRRMRTGCFPEDDTHQITLSLLDGERRVITVIAPDTPAELAEAILREVSGPAAEEQPAWENEGGRG